MADILNELIDAVTSTASDVTTSVVNTFSTFAESILTPSQDEAATRTSTAASTDSSGVTTDVATAASNVSSDIQQAFSSASSSSSSISSLNLKNIGHVLTLPTHADKDRRITNYIKKMLGVVDIIPVDYYINLKNLSKGQSVAFKYDTAASKYSSLCTRYGLTAASGLRLWTTDDTVASETYSNHFTENKLMRYVNSLESFGRGMYDMARSFGTDTLSNKLYDEATKLAHSLVNRGSSALNNYVGNSAFLQFSSGFLEGLGNVATDVVLKGHHIALPQIWLDSSYSPELSLTVKLATPYGVPEAVKKYVISPLVYILLMCSAKTNDGLSYGPTQPVQVRAYGISNMNLASLNLVSVRRGGRETSYNKYKQPLQLDISLSVSPLCGGFASVSENFNDVTVNDALSSINDLPGVSTGITTVGNIIKSLAPAPTEVVNKYNIVSSSGLSKTTTSSSDSNSGQLLALGIPSSSSSWNEQQESSSDLADSTLSNMCLASNEDTDESEFSETT